MRNILVYSRRWIPIIRLYSVETPTKYRELFPTLFLKTTDFQLVFNFEQTRTVDTRAKRLRMRKVSIFNN